MYYIMIQHGYNEVRIPTNGVELDLYRSICTAFSQQKQKATCDANAAGEKEKTTVTLVYESER